MLLFSCDCDQRSLRQTEPIDSGGKLSDHHVKTWCRGRMVLMGDSACAFLPTTGVGASMVLESAAVLAYELSRADLKFIERSLYS